MQKHIRKGKNEWTRGKKRKLVKKEEKKWEGVIMKGERFEVVVRGAGGKRNEGLCPTILAIIGRG